MDLGATLTCSKTQLPALSAKAAARAHLLAQSATPSLNCASCRKAHALMPIFANRNGEVVYRRPSSGLRFTARTGRPNSPR
jgi:hypothetical protein